MMRRKPTDPRRLAEAGYTLTEILIALAIFSVIFISALLIYDQSNRVFRKGVEATDRQQNTRVAFDKIVQDLRMTGFDYDRDGLAAGSSGGTNVYQQPDEQVEYLGRHAITVRANYDYDSDGPPNYGTEPNLESAQFPTVTIGNDEIVTYVLVSDDSSANTDTLSFYADVSVPRNAYPGGSAETQVQITGVDLDDTNPPYTLYRVTLDPNSTTLVRTPLAENIRTIEFSYFEDSTGTNPLTAIDGTTVLDPNTIGTDIGGLGQYDPSNPGALVPQRNIRSKVRSIILNLIGMDESPDFDYTDPLETITTNNVQHLRKIRLEALVAPRNFAKRGMREQSTRPPGEPTITKLCVGHCGTIYLEWTAPEADAVYGAAEQYAIMYDTDNVGGFSYFQYVGNVTSGYVYGLDPSLTYYFGIQAINSYGSATSTSTNAAQPTNSTTPQSPSNLTATNSTDGNAQTSQITLNWSLPTANDSSYATLSCTPSGTLAANWLPGEIKGYRIFRDTDPNFIPAPSNMIQDYTNPANLTLSYATGTASYVDKTVVTCTTYYYRIQGVESCRTVPSYNTGGASGVTPVFPASASPAIAGDALATGTAPNPPITLSVDAAASSCDTVTNLCTVVLNWPRVTSDTAANPIQIDDYRIYRTREKDPNDPNGPYSFPFDPNDPNAIQVTDGTSQAGTITYTDTTAEKADLSDSLLWTYHYTVRAIDCGTEGASSPSAQYPLACSFTGSVVIQTGASSGNGDPNNPWVMEGGDGFEVEPPPLDTLDIVVFTVYDSGGNFIATHTENWDPFEYSWPDLTPGEIYSVVMTVTNDSGCTEQLVRYVQQQDVASCVLPQTSQVVVSNSFSSTGADRYIRSVTLLNGGTENATPTRYSLTWRDTDTNGTTYTGSRPATLTTIAFDTASSTSPGSGAGTIALTSVPGGTGIIRPSIGYVLKFTFEAQQLRDNTTEVLTDPITSLCIVYRVPSEPGVDKFCNIIGTTANNPTGCN